MVTSAINWGLEGQTKNNLIQLWLQFNPYADIFIIITDKPSSFIVYINEQRMGSHDVIVWIQFPKKKTELS
jgi:hypothetical protein